MNGVNFLLQNKQVKVSVFRRTQRSKTNPILFYLKIKTQTGITTKSLNTSSVEEAEIKAREFFKKYNKNSEDVIPKCDYYCGDIFTKALIGSKSKPSLYCRSHSLSPVNAKKLTQITKKHILPFWATKDIRFLTLEDVLDYQDFLLRKKKLSKHYSRDIETFVKAAFAIAEDLFPKLEFKNPYRGVYARKIKFDGFDNRTEPFTTKDIMLLFSKQWKDVRTMALALVALYTGMRPAEITCLRKANLILHDDYVLININGSYEYKQKIIKEPKTKNGYRQTIIPRWLYNFIKPALNWNGCKFCFASTYGNPITSKTAGKILRSEAAKVGIADYDARGLRFYSFRPFFRSLCETIIGADSALTNFIMGHSNRSSMGEHYFHFMEDLHVPKLLEVQKTILPESIVNDMKKDGIMKYRCKI